MDQLDLAKALRKVGELPALPHVTTKVLQLIISPDSSSQDICNVLIQDQVLTSKVLRLVNSAYYGLPRKVATVTEAVTMLGLHTLQPLVLGVSVYKTLGSLKGKNVLNPEKIWKHSIAVAAASRVLAERLKFERIEQAFIAGLLHDIGKIVIQSVLPQEYEEVLHMVNETDLSLIEAERQVLSFDHTLVGKLVAEKWNLPESLVEPIGYHHTPTKTAKYAGLTQIVHLANAAAIVAGYGLGNDKDFHLDNRVLLKTNLTFDNIVALSAEVGKLVTADMLL